MIFATITRSLRLMSVFLILYACNNHTNTTKLISDTPETALILNSLRTSPSRITRDPVIDDTLDIADAKILLEEPGEFVRKFHKNPGYFYYPTVEARDFFLLHDQLNGDFYLLGGENGGCIGCLSVFEACSAAAFRIDLIPEEIQDTGRFKPHVISQSRFSIVRYPFLRLESPLRSIRPLLEQHRFLETRSNDGKSIFTKRSEFSTISVKTGRGRIERISVALNVDM